MTQIPATAFPSFFRWLEQHHENMATEYDRQTRIGNLTPTASDFLLRGMADTAALLESMKTEDED